MTDTEREALCARIDELCAENERLRQENQSIGMVAYELGRASLADENAELRKLCADLRFCRRHNCLTCSHGRFCDMRFDERCAKLGIEASE